MHFGPLGRWYRIWPLLQVLKDKADKQVGESLFLESQYVGGDFSRLTEGRPSRGHIGNIHTDQAAAGTDGTERNLGRNKGY